MTGVGDDLVAARAGERLRRAQLALVDAVQAAARTADTLEGRAREQGRVPGGQVVALRQRVDAAAAPAEGRRGVPA